jgi:hypothetical protein
VKALGDAEDWVKRATDAVRQERFRPIADAAARHWAFLRAGSSVELIRVALAGSATQRRVEIDVAVDGVGSAALGVMSQGELCSLALGMFLPRATLPESPFRFVVIDDLVLSMDPAKVDGLARVLEHVAADRQVVVLTHDDRLPQAVRRLGSPARTLVVARGPESTVSVTEGEDPISSAPRDAEAAALSERLPSGVAARVAPGLCRSAIEGACAEAIRRRRLGRGDPHAEVEALLANVTGLYEWVALALFDESSPSSTGKVLASLNRRYGPAAGDAFVNCNAGAHGKYAGGLMDLVRDVRRLATRLRQK